MYKFGILSDDEKDINHIILTFSEQYKQIYKKTLSKDNFIVYDIDRELADSSAFIAKIRSNVAKGEISGMVLSAKLNAKDIYFVEKYLKEEIHNNTPDFPVLILAGVDNSDVFNKEVFFSIDSPMSLVMAQTFFNHMDKYIKKFPNQENQW